MVSVFKFSTVPAGFIPRPGILFAAILLSLSIWISPAFGKTAVVLQLERGPEITQAGPPTQAASRAQHWRNRLSAYGYRTTIIDESSFSPAILDQDLLVLPGASRSLFEEERNLLLEFMAGGGSLILTEDAGLNFDAEVRGRSLASELGLRYRDDLYDQSESWLVLIDRPSILSANLSRMQDFSVQARRPVFVESAVESVGFWLDQRVNPPDYKSSARQTAMTYGVYGNGRFFWMGFPIDGIGGSLQNSESFHRFLGNLFDFFEKMPLAEIAPWPYPHLSTVIFSADVERQFGNIRSLMDLPNLPPFTYFVSPNQGELYAETLSELAKRTGPDQEIGVLGDQQVAFRGQPMEAQSGSFVASNESIKRLT